MTQGFLNSILILALKNKLQYFLEKHKILSSGQFSFREHMSNEDAVHQLVCDILNKLDKQKKYLLF